MSDFEDDVDDDFEDDVDDDDELEDDDDDLLSDDLEVDTGKLIDEEDEDALLAERVTAGALEDEEDDEAPLIGDSGTTKVVPRRESEFHCSSCFLVLPNHMLADKKKMLCRDCV